jgi:uncharacterized protein (UPF0248 family)
MRTVQEILNRIRWDEDFAKHKFKIAYYDRLERELVTIDFSELQFSPDDHFSFYLVDALGETHSVPYHRVKEIYSDGKIIWHREH